MSARTFLIAIIAFAAVASTVSAVTVLSGDSFNDNVGNGKTWFVKFYAPWCGHCKRLAPTWDKLSEELADNDNVEIAKVDCTVERELCSSHGVRGYPTLKLFKDGVLEGTKYAGGRDQSSLSHYVTSHSGSD